MGFLQKFFSSQDIQNPPSIIIAWAGPGSEIEKKESEKKIKKDYPSLCTYVFKGMQDVNIAFSSYNKTVRIRFLLFYLTKNHPSGISGMQNWLKNFENVANSEISNKYLSDKPKITVVVNQFDSGSYIKCEWTIVSLKDVIAVLTSLETAYTIVNWP